MADVALTVGAAMTGGKGLTVPGMALKFASTVQSADAASMVKVLPDKLPPQVPVTGSIS